MCHARATKKNNVIFYKLVYVSFQRTQHPSLEKFCCEGHNIYFLKERTLWDKYMFCTAKYRSNILFPKKKCLCHIDIAASKNMNQTSKDEEPKHRHTQKNIDTVECLRPEEVGDRDVFHYVFSDGPVAKVSNSMKTSM